jgi:hypothetical protein
MQLICITKIKDRLQNLSLPSLLSIYARTGFHWAQVLRFTIQLRVWCRIWEIKLRSKILKGITRLKELQTFSPLKAPH